MKRQKHVLYLIPGFFGFTALGEVSYWGHVQPFLEEELRRRQVEAEVITVDTLPTASIRDRAVQLLDGISQTLPVGEEVAVHLIGHSTGGLDARLLVTPLVDLRRAREVEPVARRVRSVVGLATPHHGAPLASTFTSLLGQRLLQVLSLGTIYTLRFGSLPLSVLFKLGGLITSMDDRLGLRRTLFKQLIEQLLRDFTKERQAQLRDFFTEVGVDQSLLLQLSPESMDLFNASVGDREGIRYGAVITRAARPGLRSALQMGLDPYSQASHVLYQGLHRLAGNLERALRPTLEEEQRAALAGELGQLPEADDNDGIIPTWSQLRGEIVAAVCADHLDLIGHFDDPSHQPPHFDWLVTNSGFRRRQFEALWRRTLDFCLEERHEPGA